MVDRQDQRMKQILLLDFLEVSKDKVLQCTKIFTVRTSICVHETCDQLRGVLLTW